MLEYNWKIDKVVVSPNDNGLENVIKSVYYSVDVTDSETQRTTTLSGSLALSDPDPMTFVEFNQLTNDLIKQWITNMVDMIELESQALIKLNAQQLSMMPLPN